MSSPIIHTANPLAHRTVLAVPHRSDTLAKVRRVAAAWLTHKFGSAPTASGTHHLDDRSVLTIESAYSPAGAEHAIRLQLREEASNATWRTTITATAALNPAGSRRLGAGVGALVAVELEVFPSGPVFPSAARPRLVRDLVAELTPVDGPARLTVAPQRVTVEDVETLVDILAAPDRHLPVVVAARPKRAHTTWSGRLASIAPQCAGAASLYLLDDIDAVDTFRGTVGEHHRVAPGVVRTFLPGVIPGAAPDAGRHRFLSLARLGDPADSAWNGVVRVVQGLSTGEPLPDPLQSLAFPDPGRQHREQRHAALHAARSDEAEALRSDVAELSELLTEADRELAEGKRSADLAQRRIAAQDEEIHALTGHATAYMDEALAAYAAMERVRAEVDVLRRRLLELGRYEEAFVAEPVLDPPTSFEELWERLDAFAHVTVSADRRRAIQLDDDPGSRVWAAKAWSGLRALDAYARDAHEGFVGGFYQHCTSDKPGAGGWSTQQLAMSESAQSMQAWGHERVFPVPAALDPSERMQMVAHLKLDSRGNTCPRVYFHDDTKGTTGRIVVGYVGPHLTNTRT